jgi:hypothetical protein
MLKREKRYKLIFYLFGEVVEIIGKIISINGFITFEDDYRKVYNYNKNCLVSFEEVSNLKEGIN